MAKKLTPQEKKPHKSLVECRNLIQDACGLIRSEAAALCNQLTHREVDAVLSAGNSKTKIESALKRVRDEMAKESAKPQEDSEDSQGE